MEIGNLLVDVDDIDLSVYRQHRHEIRNPLSFREGLVEHFESDPNERGAYMPFPSSHRMKFRQGEVSMWGGANFAGKSAMLTMCLLYWLRGDRWSDREEKILLISPEFSPTINIARMIQQACAKLPGQIAEPDVNAVLVWLEKRFLIYDAVGSVDIGDLMSVMKYCQAEHGTTQVAIDNLTVMKLPSQDVNQSQGELMTDLVQTARQTGLHIHLVVHTRKPSPGELVSRYNIRGSSMLSDLADNILMIERNESKERKLQDISLPDEDREEITAQADTRLHVLKQRHGSAWIGVVRLYFSPYSMRWSEKRRPADLPFAEIKELSEIGGTNTRGYQVG